ncbi:hypothetical protein GOV06_00725, partial [Candidatus Woesearchaeota archaeon]|nr:hypothetical protein [Candidatus Woesearchaeota archaeon]
MNKKAQWTYILGFIVAAASVITLLMVAPRAYDLSKSVLRSFGMGEKCKDTGKALSEYQVEIIELLESKETTFPKAEAKVRHTQLSQATSLYQEAEQCFNKDKLEHSFNSLVEYYSIFIQGMTSPTQSVQLASSFPFLDNLPNEAKLKLIQNYFAADKSKLSLDNLPPSSIYQSVIDAYPDILD